MKKFTLTVVSALALGMAGAGFAQAAQTYHQTNTSAMPASNSSVASTMPQQNEAQTSPINLSRNQVKQLQEQLRTAGLYNGRTDGRLGPETKQALQQFQQQNGLQATGKPDQQTMAALQTNQGSTGSSVSPGGIPSNNAGGSDNPINNQR